MRGNTVTSRFTIALLGLLATLAVLPAAQAQAAGSKVLLTQEIGDEPATQGEVSAFSGSVGFAAIECLGTDEHGTMGKNPSGNVKIAGSNVPETAIFCTGENPKDAVTIKSMTISKSGLVTLKLEAIVQTDAGCTYRLTKLQGTVEAGGQTSSAELFGTAHLKGSESPKTCAKTAPAHGREGVSNASFENYTVNFV